MLNELEAAILERFANHYPHLQAKIRDLHVLSRKFTGVGCYTNFACGESGPRSHLWLREVIKLPGARIGLGAVLFFKGEEPEFLEVYTYDELWDGDYAGFTIEG